MARERRKEHNLGQTTAIYLLEPGRGAKFCEHSSVWGVLKLSRHPIINPPHLSWLFSFFLFQFEICPPHSSSLIPQWFDGGKSVRRMQGGGRWSSLAGRVSSLSTYLNLARFRNIWNWKFLPSSYSGLHACLLASAPAADADADADVDARPWTKYLEFGKQCFVVMTVQFVVEATGSDR